MKHTLRFATTSLVISMCGAQTRADVITRRGGETPIEAKIVIVDEAGVTVERAPGQLELIRWDRVREVQSKSFEKDVERYEADAQKLWRARSRLERGDAALAEPIFERLFESYRGMKHETALVVAEGLLRCRLARGAHDAAIVPALESIRLRREVATAANVYAILRPVIDPATSLCTALPPAWVSSSQLLNVERDLSTYDGQGDVVVSAIAALYQEAIRQQMGMTASESGRALAQDHAGVLFLRLIVQVNSPDPTDRAAAREQLARELPKTSDWAQAWTHYAIGCSLAMESETPNKQMGMVHLAHVPAKFSREEAYLAGMAVFQLASTLEQLGDSRGAAALRNELKLLYANHPATSAVQVRKTAPVSHTQPSTTILKESS